MGGVLLSRKASIYNPQDISIGSNVRIDDFCILSGKIDIGNYVHISAYSALYGGGKGIYINDYVGISSRVTIYALSDDYSGACLTNPMISNEYRKVIEGPVIIEKHVIIGSTSVVLPNVTLKEGSAFGSLSFINHDSQEYSINVGIPFKKIKNRNKDIIKLEKEFNDSLK